MRSAILLLVYTNFYVDICTITHTLTVKKKEIKKARKLAEEYQGTYIPLDISAIEPLSDPWIKSSLKIPVLYYLIITPKVAMKLRLQNFLTRTSCFQLFPFYHGTNKLTRIVAMIWGCFCSSRSTCSFFVFFICFISKYTVCDPGLRSASGEGRNRSRS